MERSLSALASISVHDKNFLCKREMAHDVINLSYGRDFLMEARLYDVVVIHSILSPQIKGFWRFPRLQVSPIHSLKMWRRRLVETSAKYIVICKNDPATLSGGEIGRLSGYDIIKKDETQTVYVKQVTA